MSEYTEFHYEVDYTTDAATVGLLAGLGELIDAGMAVASETLSALETRYLIRQQAFADLGLRPVEARLCALDEVPLLRAAVMRAAAGGDPVTSGTERLRQCDTATFDRLLAAGFGTLREAETGLVQRACTETLADLGWQPRTPRRATPGRVSVQATAADGTTVSLRLTPRQARAELDLAGFAPGVCLRARAALIEGLARRGLRLTATASLRHDDLAGSRLTTEMRAALEDEATATPRERRPLASLQRQRY